jgi:hypothetical protein
MMGWRRVTGKAEDEDMIFVDEVAIFYGGI